MGWKLGLFDTIGIPGIGGGAAREIRKLARKGLQSQATIIGMRQFSPKIRRNVSEADHRLEPHLQLAMHVHEPSFVAGFECEVGLFDDPRLGQVVPVRHDGTRAIPAFRHFSITASGENLRFCDPPSQGIVDETLWNHVAVKRKRDAVPAWITFIEAEVIRTSGLQFGSAGSPGLSIGVRALIQGDGFDPYETEMVRLEQREYASHLDELNLPLPGWARPGAKRTPFIVDWAGAANRDPGTDRPAGYFYQLLRERQTLQIGGGEVTANSFTPQGAIADSAAHDGIDGVTFETWATIVAKCEVDKIHFPEQDEYAQQFGVPAGAWAAMNREWGMRMMKDPRLNVAMAQIRKAVRQARKG